jgi:hypothetical protein
VKHITLQVVLLIRQNSRLLDIIHIVNQEPVLHLNFIVNAHDPTVE